jgi:hypothetical protein
MKYSHLLLLAAGVPLLACAQAQHAPPAADDPNAPVTPLQYQSVFADYVKANDAMQSPEKGWVHANDILRGAETAAPAPGNPPAAPGHHEHQGAHQ